MLATSRYQRSIASSSEVSAEQLRRQDSLAESTANVRICYMGDHRAQLLTTTPSSADSKDNFLIRANRDAAVAKIRQGMAIIMEEMTQSAPVSSVAAVMQRFDGNMRSDLEVRKTGQKTDSVTRRFARPTDAQRETQLFSYLDSSMHPTVEDLVQYNETARRSADAVIAVNELKATLPSDSEFYPTEVEALTNEVIYLRNAGASEEEVTNKVNELKAARVRYNTNAEAQAMYVMSFSELRNADLKSYQVRF